MKARSRIRQDLRFSGNENDQVQIVYNFWRINKNVKKNSKFTEKIKIIYIWHMNM